MKILVVTLAAISCGIVACGGGDDRSKNGAAASQTQTSASSTGESGSARSRRGSSPGTRSGSSGDAHNDGPSSASGPGGARAPRIGRTPRKRALLRYLATNYRRTPWYPLLRKLRITGGHVIVYLVFSPESDDEAPPALACSAVLSYGKQVKSVTVYGSPTSQGRTMILKQC